jgi:hypothetical protein
MSYVYHRSCLLLCEQYLKHFKDDRLADYSTDKTPKYFVLDSSETDANQFQNFKTIAKLILQHFNKYLKTLPGADV